MKFKDTAAEMPVMWLVFIVPLLAVICITMLTTAVVEEPEPAFGECECVCGGAP